MRPRTSSTSSRDRATTNDGRVLACTGPCEVRLGLFQAANQPLMGIQAFGPRYVERHTLDEDGTPMQREGRPVDAPQYPHRRGDGSGCKGLQKAVHLGFQDAPVPMYLALLFQKVHHPGWEVRVGHRQTHVGHLGVAIRRHGMADVEEYVGNGRERCVCGWTVP